MVTWPHGGAWHFINTGWDFDSWLGAIERRTAIRYVSEGRWLFCPSHFPREQAKAPCVEYITTRKQNSGETQDKNIFKMQGALTMVTWWCLPPEILNTKWLCFLTWFFKKMTLYVVDEWWFILPSPFPILWMRKSSATKKNPKKKWDKEMDSIWLGSLTCAIPLHKDDSFC